MREYRFFFFNMTLKKLKLTYEKSDKNGNAVQCNVKHFKYILNKVQLTLDLCIITRQLKERKVHVWTNKCGPHFIFGLECVLIATVWLMRNVSCHVYMPSIKFKKGDC